MSSKSWYQGASVLRYVVLTGFAVCFQLACSGLRHSDELVATFGWRSVSTSLLRARTRFALILFPGLLGAVTLITHVLVFIFQLRYFLIFSVQRTTTLNYAPSLSEQCANFLSAIGFLVFFSAVQVLAATAMQRIKQVPSLLAGVFGAFVVFGLGKLMHLAYWELWVQTAYDEATETEAFLAMAQQWRIAYHLVTFASWVSLSGLSMWLAGRVSSNSSPE